MATYVRKLRLVNLALAQLGEAQFAELDADAPAPKLAKALAQVDEVVGFMLRRHPWLSATTYLTLAASASLTGPAHLPYAYELPADTIRVWAVNPEAPCPPKWRRATLDKDDVAVGVILADAAGPIVVEAVRRSALEVVADDLFTAMAYELAQRICGPVTGGVADVPRLQKLAEWALGVAMGSDGTEMGREAPMIPSQLAALRQSAG